jgi:hypothetical protein
MRGSVNVLFGIKFPISQIQDALGSLRSGKSITRPLGTNYSIDPNVKTRLEEHIEQARELEERVQREWFTELSNHYPNLEHQVAWKTLRSYAAKAFREHGVQAAALLDPSISRSEEYEDSLTTLLNNTLNRELESHPEVLKWARHAITDFFSNMSGSLNRATYIAQLADGAFNYFSLAIDPRSAKRFRENLSPLTVFLDTNILFSILGLNSEPTDEVANELLRIIQKHEFPFTLCCHEKTVQELRHTIDYYGDRLRGRYWSQHISRAAMRSIHLRGIEQRYHQQNAEQPISVEAFLKPLEHADVLLEQKGICFVKHQANQNLVERADLFEEYQKYLRDRHIFKFDKMIQHDTVVLSVVYQRRSEALSSLDTGAILLSHDYSLYGFDKKRSESSGYSATVVFPNQLLQILRPFLPSGGNFDVSFAETFAIPEFRTASSGASEVSSKLLTLLAGYKEFPEETATQLLSNDILIEGLKGLVKNNEEFEKQVELAIARENQSLLEDKAALAQQLEERESEKAQTEEAKLASDAHAAQFEQRAKEAAASAQKEKEARETAEKRAIEAEQRADRQALFTASLLSLLSTVGFFVAIYQVKWDWLLDHPNGYGLQASTGLFILLFTFGIFYAKWRKTVWVSGAFAVLLVILQILGGRN